MMPTLKDGSSVGVCDLPAKPSTLPKTHRNNRLTLKQHLFIDAYLTHGKNGRQAYLSLHPNSQPESADVNASKLLRIDKVREEIIRRVRYEQGITREQIESDLLLVRDMAIAKDDPQLLDQNAMNRAKLGGYLIDRKDVTTHDESKSSPIRSLVDHVMGQTGKG